MFVENDLGTAEIVSALFNGTNVPPDAQNKVTFTPIAGQNRLIITVECPTPGPVRFKEDCGGGVSQALETFDSSEPSQEYRIHGR